MSAHKARFVSRFPSTRASGNGQWINSGETRASVKQIFDVAARRVHSSVGDFRTGVGGGGGEKEKRKKEKDRFRWIACDIDVKSLRGLATICLAAKFRKNQPRRDCNFAVVLCILLSLRAANADDENK